MVSSVASRALFFCVRKGSTMRPLFLQVSGWIRNVIGAAGEALISWGVISTANVA